MMLPYTFVYIIHFELPNVEKCQEVEKLFFLEIHYMNLNE